MHFQYALFESKLSIPLLTCKWKVDSFQNKQNSFSSIRSYWRILKGILQESRTNSVLMYYLNWSIEKDFLNYLAYFFTYVFTIQLFYRVNRPSYSNVKHFAATYYYARYFIQTCSVCYFDYSTIVNLTTLTSSRCCVDNHKT